MAFQIKSAGLVTTGTSGADLFAIEAAAGQKTTVLGLAGADTINAGGGLTTATSMIVNAAGGADQITMTAGNVISSSTVLGGAGGDAITLDLTGFNASVLNGGDGNDTITISAGTFSAASLTLGEGVDIATLSAGNFNNSTVAAGSGNDTIIFSGATDLGSAQIFGGGGADQITISAVAGNSTGLQINADSSANGGGADTILFSADAVGGFIKGKGGKDVITVDNIGGTGTQILGNAGADLITVTGNVVGSANLIGGGQGNDTITIGNGTFATGNSIVGGGGADSITISGAAFNGVLNVGAGQDTIAIESVSGGTVALGALTDSTLTKLDSYSNNVGEEGSGFSFSLSAITTTLMNTGVAGGTDFTPGTIFSGGVVQSGDFATAGGVTARAALIDAQGGGANTVFLFQASNVNYLFIQGGSAGTADDYVAQVGTGTTTFLGGISVGSGSITL